MSLAKISRTVVAVVMLMMWATVRFPQDDYLQDAAKTSLGAPVNRAAYAGTTGVDAIVRSVYRITEDGFPVRGSGQALLALQPDAPFPTRSIKDAQLFARVSPGVVLVVTSSGLGSGSLISQDGIVLTNWHVVGGSGDVGVIFKPTREGAQPIRSDVRRATIIKVDEIADLALLKVGVVPTKVAPIALGTVDEIGVGIDVHAIGHPTGEAWSYTKGVVSQYRLGYEWMTEKSAKKHRANVIQTQTPINPGNSGGPLLLDSGALIGVNSFKAVQGEGLNFAVSIEDVRRFLSSSGSRKAQEAPVQRRESDCEAKEIYRGQNAERTGNVVGIDLDCDGKVDAELRTPNDVSQPIIVVFDRNGDGRPDVVVFDTDRDGKWEFSFWDNDFDGKWDLVGYHPDGSLRAARFESYDSVSAALARRR